MYKWFITLGVIFGCFLFSLLVFPRGLVGGYSEPLAAQAVGISGAFMVVALLLAVIVPIVIFIVRMSVKDAMKRTGDILTGKK